MFYIIILIGFIYLWSEIRNLENKIEKLSGGKQESGNVSNSVIIKKPEEIEVKQQLSVATSVQRTEDRASAEFALGTKAFTIIGGIALLIGVGFFLRYVFESGLISETMRIVLGMLLGVIISILGLWLRKKYSNYGLVLFGLGLGVIYISTYAAHNFYSLIGSIPAFLLLIFISLVGVVTSIKLNSLPLVSFSLAGAYIIMLLLPFSESIHGLFLYLIVLNMLVIIINGFKRWPQLTVGSIIATFLIIISWMSGNYLPSMFNLVLIYNSILFAGHAVSVVTNILNKKETYKNIESFLFPAIPILYALLTINIFTNNTGRSLLFCAIGIIYLIGFLFVRSIANQTQNKEGLAFSNIMLLISGLFIAASISLFFQGSVITYLLIVESLALIFAGNVLQSKINRLGGVLLAIVVLIRMFVFDYTLATDAMVIFNTRALLSIIVSIMFALIYIFYNFYQKTVPDEQKSEYGDGKQFGLIGVMLVSIIWLNSEIISFSEIFLNQYLSIAWIWYAGIMLAIGFWLQEKWIRIIAYIVIAPTVLISLLNSADYYGSILFNIRGAVLGSVIAVLIITYILLKIHRNIISESEFIISKWSLVAVNFVAVIFGSIEINDFYKTQLLGEKSENVVRVVLSVFYLLYAGIALTIGILKKSYTVRVMAIVLLVFTIIKIFLYDTANLNDIYKFISFMSLGVILLIAGFAYYKFKDRIIGIVPK